MNIDTNITTPEHELLHVLRNDFSEVETVGLSVLTVFITDK